ncbi:dihydrodipicolinate synthase family protein [Catenulispora sp. NF23]|uniref:Dihydrodipicolinate synthase family protein n=1 Tax=Catenulispora pinistramenti TaxID=2705254 RepID=A0ABS5KK64_9ACTN|nr:dihydrodipicolinate synthase family protein [Catenulispora pinistramenti]MBS2545586.1 dihydrodipicolinate synthase family protein [Catenulispora pinistramenti]
MTGFTSRVVYAAAHVVADPNADNGPGRPAVLDWDATLRFREHLWSLGFGIADAMDTAQRGMGLDWPATQELIRRSGAAAKAVDAANVPSLLACGAGTDQLAAGAHPLPDIQAAYEEQLGVVEGAGARVILMASRAMAASAKSAEDYLTVYGSLLNQASNPVILHWLGDMFDPALAGYWGSSDIPTAMDTVLDLINADPAKVDGIKVSLLNADYELELRRRLPEGVRLYTGDDFNYPDLIKGDEHGHSDALLGIFDGIARPASQALQALDRGDLDAYDRLMTPTVELSRHIFERPTFNYKTGLVFLAYLNGHQDHFRMVGGLETARDAAHLTELLRLAEIAGVIDDPESAAARFQAVVS